MNEISKDSLIYKYLLSDRQKGIIHENKGDASICWLFWAVLFNLIGQIFLFSFLTAIVVFFGVMVFSSIVDTIIYFAGFTEYRLPSGAVGASALMNWILGLYGILLILCNNLKRGYKKAKRYTVSSLTFDYIKAKKDRFCPTVKFVDSKDN